MGSALEGAGLFFKAKFQYIDSKEPGRECITETIFKIKRRNEIEA